MYQAAGDDDLDAIDSAWSRPRRRLVLGLDSRPGQAPFQASANSRAVRCKRRAGVKRAGTLGRDVARYASLMDASSAGLSTSSIRPNPCGARMLTVCSTRSAGLSRLASTIALAVVRLAVSSGQAFFGVSAPAQLEGQHPCVDDCLGAAVGADRVHRVGRVAGECACPVPRRKGIPVYHRVFKDLGDRVIRSGTSSQGNFHQFSGVVGQHLGQVPAAAPVRLLAAWPSPSPPRPPS